VAAVLVSDEQPRKEILMQAAEQLHDWRMVEDRLQELKKNAGRVRRKHGDKMMRSWPDSIRASALALVGDGVSTGVVANAVGVVEQTIVNWRKAKANKSPVRELRIVPDSSGETGRGVGAEESAGKLVRITVGKSMEIFIPAGQFKLEWLLALAKGMQPRSRSVGGESCWRNIPSRMLRTPEKNFPVGTIFNMVRFAANCAEPVYHVLAKQLGQVGYLEGDDTNTKCHQMKKSKEVLEDEAKAKKKAAQSEEPEDPDPFAAERSLVDRVATYLGRFFAGTTVEEKSGIHLSMVTGCTNIDDERTRIIFYRTHRGTVGDLLGQLWSFDKKKRKIKFTCDLNAQNVPAERLRKHIDLTIGGCVAHLRRGFRAACKLEAASDDCRYLLQLFRRLYDMERMARDEGNTLELISWYRQRYGKILWKLIFEKIEEMSKKWLKNTGDLGDHIAYALKNRKAFMVYLDDPRMPIDNNFSERNLRPEKVHMANSRQHLTEDGRVAFDILLTMIRTCACAQVSPQDWLIWVMKNRDEVKQRPELYTPYQYRLLLQKP
jgi:hypothetical protein